MSTSPEVPETLETPEAPAPVCPISMDVLPQSLRKHVDPKAPLPLRLMGAKALVPLPPQDMISALFLLTFDPEASIRDTARQTAKSLPDRILASGFRDEGVPPPVLGYFLETYGTQDTYAEMLILNASTPDAAVAVAALTCGLKVAEIIGQNQLRLLRHEDILRSLCQNTAATASLLDSVCDFAVRSGLHLPDVEQMQAARIRLFGPEVAKAPVDLGPTAEEILADFAEVKDETAPPLDEGKRLTLSQRVMKMSISEKIKLATLGNKEARSMLIRDTNKLVATAVIRSPRITDGEVLSSANNRAMHDDVLRIIYSSREMTKSYVVKVALVKNPKVPMAVALKFLTGLRDSEVKDLSRDKNVPSGIQTFAKRMIDKKSAPKNTEK